MKSAVRVWAPSRLHFGLLSFGQHGARQYGGAGVMIDAPGLALSFEPAARLSAAGPLAERAMEFARRYCEQVAAENAPACHIEIQSAPPEHAGLGTGTQLALAVAAGLDALSTAGTGDPTRWARLMGRGERSAIGTHGFAHGGLLVEGGKLEPAGLSPLVSRIELPEAWRFVLLVDREERGLSGAAERQAFAELPAVPQQATAELSRELVLNLIPAAASGNLAEFGESLYRYGYQAGMLFAKRQGGPFAGRRGAELVQWARDQGVRGVGQSSWGPTIFALLADAPSAADFAARAQVRFAAAPLEIIVAGVANRGARIEPLKPHGTP
jgi:beta-RFAP synthase